MNRFPGPRQWDDHTLLLVRVATLYYEMGMNQDEIAREIGVSRSRISRLVSEARDRGIVEIRIHHPLSRSVVLEQELKERFPLKAARVLAEENLEYDDMVHRLGALAADYIEDQVFNGALLGLSWGTAVSAVIRAIRRPGRCSVDVVQLVGSAGKMGPELDGLELARHLAELFGGRCYYMRAPLIVKSPEVARALMEDPEIREALDVAARADFAVVGVGSMDPRHSTVLQMGYLSSQELQELAQCGAVGDICSRRFDAQGREIDSSLNGRFIGVSLDKLKNIPRVIAVAGGIWKADAILAAMRGGLINVLVTDRATAEIVLKKASAIVDTKAEPMTNDQ